MHYKHFDVNNSLFDIPTTKENNDAMLASKIFVFWYIIMLKKRLFNF